MQNECPQLSIVMTSLSVSSRKNVCQEHFLRKCQWFFVYNFKIQIGWMCHYPLVLVVIIIVIPSFHLRLSFLHFQLLFCIQTTTAEREKNQKKIIINLFLLISSSQILLVPEKWNYSQRPQLKGKIHPRFKFIFFRLLLLMYKSLLYWEHK